MPGFDGRGPMGEGPLTGGGRGYCAGSMIRGRRSPFGRGVYGGRGGGRGYRNMYRLTGLTGWQRAGYYGAPYGPDVERGNTEAELKARAEFLERELEAIRKRIDGSDREE